MRALLLALLVLLPAAAAGTADASRGDLIVTFREGAAPSGLPLLGVVPSFVLLDATQADHDRYLRDPRVERVDWAIPLETHSASGLPSSAFHDLTRSAPRELTGRGITIAVLDSGIDAAHADLAGRVAENVRLVDKQFVPSAGDADGHGTHVAGIVAASGAASGGRWGGVAPEARLVGLDISGRFTTASALLAYDWLHANRERLDLRIVVNAWGRVGSGEPFDARDPEIRAIDRLVASGVVVLFSASNHGPAPGTLSVEAQDPRVITVGATDAAGLLMPYSSRGPVAADAPWPKPDVVAPGDAVVGPRSAGTAPRAEDPDALHTIYSGTSQAVPHVAGIVAQMLQARPDLRPDEVAAMLRASAIDLAPAGLDDATGFGLVDGHDALRLARGLEPDRGNVLVAGGTDVATDETGLSATARRSLLDLVSQPQVVWETPFAVKVGAETLRAEVEADGARSLAVELVKDARVVRGGEVDRPEPGVWTLRLRGAIPAPTTARASFHVTLPAHPERALETDGRVVAPDPPAPEREALLGGISVAAWIPIVAWGAAGALVAYGIMPRRRSEG